MTQTGKCSKSDKTKDTILFFALVFVVGGIVGFLYEELFYLIDLGYLVKRGTTFGPWIPIYGFGAILILLATKKIKKKPIAVFFVSVAITGTLEFLTGYVLFHCFGVRLWDYNVEILNWGNIGGYVCFRSVLVFGIAALGLQYAIVPIILHMKKSISREHYFYVAVIPAALFVIDILLSLVTKAL